ncbi:endonuclease domain-containing protein [Microbacterium sp. SSW1-49]|uniref:Endonuclease domain-containing protein n=1 Tax=Microbacterium croceum TaxID=2851645 RepID=A0ABT0FD87_9MICO|nr:DUF559 domain-containing protein [Microbacterium croceum]MCK2036018.1 endonuclease domain-containing protein [Microbacterium croceum]
MDLKTWMTTRGGIAHREDAREHGYPPSRIRAAIRESEVERIRAKWIVTAAAPQDLRAAAAASARVTCVSLARRREWWIPEDAPAGTHLHVGTNAHRHAGDAVLHWSEPLVDAGPRALVASIEDALAHVARCFVFEDAMTIWESAMRRESLDVASLRAVRWRDRASRELAHAVRGRSDSGLETVFVVRLSGWGIPIRQQVRLAGHDVDVVLGSHLVIQLDGFAHHSRSADRGRDVAHDAELRLRGYTVIRFTYAQILHDWAGVERTVAAAIARGLHLPPATRTR